MAYQVLARKYRPQRFSDVAGQEHVTRTLLNALEQGRIAHGYIFSGHRGIGKTTIARILAMALNCRNSIGSPERPTPEPCGVCESCREIRGGNALDMLEIDAATNRGIDEIRELRDAARYSPARDRYKVYLLDEAHQITDAAFNALLKILEEPPGHVVFMMATTQPEDIPSTIRSRCQHFSFHAVKFDDILAELREIAGKEDLLADDAALALLAEAGDGSMRDALSIMDQAIGTAPLIEGKAKLEAEQIRELMGTVPNTVFERLLEAVGEGQSATVMEEINQLLNAGNSPSQLARQLVRYLRNALMAKLGGETTELLQISADERNRAGRSAALFSEEDLTRFLQVMLRTFDELNYRQEQRFHLELGLLKLVHLQRLLPIEQILSGLPGASRPSAGAGSRAAGSGAVSVSSPAGRPVQAATPRPRPDPPVAVERGAAAPQVVLAEAVVAATTVLPSFTPQPQVPIGKQSEASEGISPAAVAVLSEPVRPAAAAQISVADLDRLRDAVVGALDSQGHNTAAAVLAAARWKVQDDGSIEAEVSVSKTMLGLALNGEAWKIVRQALQSAGAGQKMMVVPGQPAAPGQGGTPAPRGDSIQAALDHPLVQQAQELFRAEVRNVLDLRESPKKNSGARDES